MATRSRKKTPKPAPPPPAPTVQSTNPNVIPYLGALNQIAGQDKAVGAGLAGGAELGMLLYGNGALGRVDEDWNPDLYNLYQRQQQEAAMPTQQSADTTAGLGRLADAAASSSIGNPNVQGSIDALKSASDASAISNPVIQARIAALTRMADASETMDPRLTEILDLEKGRLGGLNSQEMTAAREDAQSGMNRGLATTLRALKSSNLASGGPRGGGATIGALPAISNFAQGQTDLERKLILDNYAAKEAALTRYASDSSGFLDTFTKNRIAAQDAANSGIVNYNTGATNAASNLSSGVNAANTVASNAASAYATKAADVNQMNITDRANRLANYTGFLTNLRADFYNRHLENLNRIAAEKAGFTTSVFGGGAFSAEQAGREQAFELGKENLEFQRKLFGGGGGTSFAGGNSGGASASDSFGAS